MTPVQYLLRVMRDEENPVELRTQVAIALLDHPDEWLKAGPVEAPPQKQEKQTQNRVNSRNGYWNPREVAEYLGVSVRHAQERVTRRRDFPTAYRLGARRWWKKELVIEWFELRKEK